MDSEMATDRTSHLVILQDQPEDEADTKRKIGLEKKRREKKRKQRNAARALLNLRVFCYVSQCNPLVVKSV